MSLNVNFFTHYSLFFKIRSNFSCVDEVILTHHIEKLVEKDYTDDMNILRTVYFQDLYLPTYDEKETFRSKVQALNSHIMMNGRIGHATTLIIDPKFVKFFDADIHHLWSSYDFFTHKGLNNKIILAHINVSNSSEKMGYNMFHTDNYYAIEEIGDFDNLYHVLDIKCLKYDRTKKLQRILK